MRTDFVFLIKDIQSHLLKLSSRFIGILCISQYDIMKLLFFTVLHS